MNYFLVYSIGNCGSSWLEAALNTHAHVRAWEEVHKHIGIPDQTPHSEVDPLVIEFLRSYDGPERSIGLIKSFSDNAVEWCVSVNGHVMQLLRHPIKVLGYKYRLRQKYLECVYALGHEPVDEEELYLGYVLWYGNAYRQMIDRPFPIIRLEDIASSFLEPDRLYFRCVVEHLTQVNWVPSQVETVAEMPHPKGEARWKQGDWAEDLSHTDIWYEWDPWQRAIFLASFQEIMISLGYGWPR